jgi:sialate O-acetylesterase
MSQKFLLVVLATALIIEGCSKTEYTPKPQYQSHNGDDAISNSTGLALSNVNDYGIYQIISSNGGVAEVANSSTKVGGTGDVNTYAGLAFQKWKITQVGSGYFTIMNLGSGLYAQSYDYSGTQVLIQNTVNSSDSQLWGITMLNGKIYSAINKADGLAITANGNAMIQLKPFANLPSQEWGYDALPSNDTLKAKVFSVANILQSNMVIQRDKPFNVWGSATAGVVVSVKVSWNTSLLSATSNAAGSWILTIPATPVNASPQTIIASVNGIKADTLSNILIGDVWIASGQSNMVMPMTQVNNPATDFGGFYGVQNYQEEIANANHPNLRYTRVPPSLQTSPQKDISSAAQWSVCSPATAGNYSALSYYFGEKIDSALNVPVGMIMSAFSNTGCEVWTSAQTIQSNSILDPYYSTRSYVSEAYNAMIYPLQNLAIKGFIWDQGENNETDSPASNYTLLNSAMLTQWRSLFKQGDLPFYFVEMCPLYNGDPDTSTVYARFRQAQANVRNLTNTGMAVTMDIGDLFVIHYTFKEPVGDRLARLALTNAYGLPIQALGPSYKSHSQSGATVTIDFNNANGLKSIGSLSQNFIVCGDNHVFYKAQAAIRGNTIVLTVPSNVTTVRAVRYSFTNTAISSLYNSDNLPMEPFRTDNY